MGREVFLVDVIHWSEVGHVVKKDGGLNDSGEIAVGCFQDCLDIDENRVLACCKLWMIKWSISDRTHGELFNGT